MTPPAPRLRLAAPLTAAGVVTVVRESLPTALASYLPRQRWFGDKDRQLAAVAVADLAVLPAGGDWLVPAVVEVGFGDGGSARYFVPLAATLAPLGTEPIATVEDDASIWTVADAFALPAFPPWLLDQLATDASWETAAGAFRWSHEPALRDVLAAAQTGEARVGSAEQSNTSVIFGDALFLKAFRRLRSGVNPDEEVGRFLAARTAFRHLPLPVAGCEYVGRDERSAVALVQTYVPSVADGWSFTLAHLAGGPMTTDEALLDPLHQLGERTGQLHRALATPTDDAAFAPEPIGDDDIARWESDALAAIEAVAVDLQARAGDLAPELRTLVGAFTASLPRLRQRATGFRALRGLAKTRVHGDYHLGQVLRTVRDDWVILDFEGEPSRPLAERRAKTSPLKDVAGMLRSFAYARGAALRAPYAHAEDAASRLAAWEAEARARYLAGYLAAAEGTPPFLPTVPDAFAAALAAWELDKALYEVRYELSNRPDWLALPLASLIPDTTG
jgi:maltose alpha-D-glucosyltransferase/alpha-amylase